MPNPSEIFLTQAEYKHALDVGYERNIKHRHANGERLGTKYRTGRKLPDIAGDMLGCVAEAAVAKFYETKWNDDAWDLNAHVDMKRAPDVEPNFEVRRVNEITGQLSLRHDDEKTKVGILAYVDYENSQKVTLLGGILIEEAMEKAVPAEHAEASDWYIHFRKDNNYMVMQSGLYDVHIFNPVLTHKS